MSQTPITGAFDRTERTGSPALVLIFAVVFVSAALASAFLPPEQGGRVTIALLAVLAVVGVIALFAYAVGFLRIAGRSARDGVWNGGLLMMTS